MAAGQGLRGGNTEEEVGTSPRQKVAGVERGMAGLQVTWARRAGLHNSGRAIMAMCATSDPLTCFPAGPRPLPGGPASPKRKLEAAEEPPGEELSKRARVAELPTPEPPSKDA